MKNARKSYTPRMGHPEWWCISKKPRKSYTPPFGPEGGVYDKHCKMHIHQDLMYFSIFCMIFCMIFVYFRGGGGHFSCAKPLEAAPPLDSPPLDPPQEEDCQC